MRDILLSAQDLCVSYGPVDAVCSVSIDVGVGEHVALLGANGAGKTSVLRALSRLVPSTGSIRFNGIDIASLDAEGVTRAGILHVPEGRGVLGPLTVHENVLVGRSALARREPRFTVSEVYDLFPELAPLRDRAGASLSGGEQQMLAIARALVGSPTLLLLDEPTLGLAPIVVDRLAERLRALAGVVPMLVVEQNTTLALDLCERGYVLASGRVVLAGLTEDLRNDTALVSSYLGVGVSEAGT